MALFWLPKLNGKALLTTGMMLVGSNLGAPLL